MPSSGKASASLKMLAAVSDASVSAPMLKRTLCSGCRRALQSTATLVIASGSAARQPNSDDAARQPTALTESTAAPSSASSASACPTPTSPSTREQAEQILRGPAERKADDARRHAERADEPDRKAEALVEREEARTVDGVRPRMARRRLRRSCLRAAPAQLPAAASDGSSSSGHRDQPRGPVGRDEQRLRARAEDAVAPLELRAVDGEVGLVDQLVRVRAVLRIAGDADRDRRADRLARRLDVERPLRDGAADALRDLHRLLRRRLRQEDRELLAAEARRHVVVAELRRGRRPRCP